MANIQRIINTNSSFSVSKSDALLESTILKVWIYEGEQGDQSASALVTNGGRPNEATYELTATSVSYEQTRVTSFQLAPLVKDYVESRIVNGQYSTNSVWVDYQLTNIIDGVESIDTSVQGLGIDGYLYTSDTNDGLDKGLRLSNKEILNKKGQLFSIPVLRNNLVKYTFENQGVVIKEGTLGSSIQSDEQVVYLSNTLDGTTPFDCDKVIISHATGNICQNGSFESDSVWTKETSDWTINNGVSFLSSSDLDVDRLYQDANANGLDLTLNFEISNYSGQGTASLRYPFNVSFSEDGVYSTSGTGELDRIQFQGLSSSNADPLTFKVDNVSVYPTQNIVQDVITIENVEECKYDSRRLTFINKCGAFQDVWMFKNSKKTLEVKSDTWNRMNPLSGGSIDRASKVKVNTVANEKITLNSGFYPESSNVVFEELLQSEKVWMWSLEDTPRAQAINITDTSINLKDSITDKAINYTINIEMAYNKYRSL